jgi:uncharacterized protein YndB with AHSA1/START domain
MTATAKTAPYGEASVTLTRVFNAPRALVWKAWTDSKMMAQWFGPRGFTNPVCELDVRVGGSLYIVMRGPDRIDYPMKGVFREVSAPERLVFTNIAIDRGQSSARGRDHSHVFGERRQDHPHFGNPCRWPCTHCAANACGNGSRLDPEHR